MKDIDKKIQALLDNDNLYDDFLKTISSISDKDQLFQDLLFFHLNYLTPVNKARLTLHAKWVKLADSIIGDIDIKKEVDTNANYLSFAAYYSSEEMLEYLFSKGLTKANPECTVNLLLGLINLMYTKNSNKDFYYTLIEDNKELINKFSPPSLPPLLYCASSMEESKNNYQLIDCLLKCGAKLDIKISGERAIDILLEAKNYGYIKHIFSRIDYLEDDSKSIFLPAIKSFNIRGQIIDFVLEDMFNRYPDKLEDQYQKFKNEIAIWRDRQVGEMFIKILTEKINPYLKKLEAKKQAGEIKDKIDEAINVSKTKNVTNKKI